MIINDKVLIETLESYYAELKLPDYSVDTIRKAISDIKNRPEFANPSFSLFQYSSVAEKDKLTTLDELWKKVLRGSIQVLKFHDLRENPTRYSDANKININGLTRPDIREIADYYQAVRNFERVLYGLEPWYRDHFVHVIRTWLLCLFIISKKADSLPNPPPICSDKDKSVILFKKEELLAILCISALTHDLGYPLEKVIKLNSEVAKMLDSFGGIEWERLRVSLSPPRFESAQRLLKLVSGKPEYRNRDGKILPIEDIKGYIDQCMSDYKLISNTRDLRNAHDKNYKCAVLRSQWKYFEKYSSSLENSHHGLISALILQQKLIFFQEGEFALEEDFDFSLEEIRQFMIRREILRAVSTHTCPRIYLLNPMNIEALIYFADEMQEWGRPSFHDLYTGQTNGATSIMELSDYNEQTIKWVVDANTLDSRRVTYWLLHIGRALYQRLRSAPEADRREFDLTCILKWKSLRTNKDYNAIFSFFKDPTVNSSFIITFPDGATEDIIGKINRLEGGTNENKILSELEECILRHN